MAPLSADQAQKRLKAALEENGCHLTDDELRTAMARVGAPQQYDEAMMLRLVEEGLHCWARKDQTAAMTTALGMNQLGLEKDFEGLKAKFNEMLGVLDEVMQISGISQDSNPRKKVEEMRGSLEKKVTEVKPTTSKEHEKHEWEGLTYEKAFKDLNGSEELTTWNERSSQLCQKYAISQEVKSLMEGCEVKARSVKVNYQPYVDTLDELFDFHEKKAPKFTNKVRQLAEETGGKPLIPNLKGKERCLAKATYKYADAGGVAWYRLTDIVRATILYPSISAMYKGLEAIEKDESIEIIELNDRYQKPLDGYMDLQLSIRIEEMVCELQLNTEKVAYVKEHSGHREFEVKRELVAAVAEMSAERCRAILQWGKINLGPKADEELKKLLNDKQDPVLHQAAKKGNAALVKIFLQYGADIDHRDSHGRTALHLAMAGGHERAAWALISHKAQVDLEDAEGLTPLMHGLLAVRSSMDSESAVRAVSVLAQHSKPGSLQSQQDNLEAVVKRRLTSRSELIVAARDGQVQDVRNLLGQLADPNVAEHGTGVTPLRAALTPVAKASSAHDEVIELLLKFRADPSAQNNDRQHLLEAVLQNRTSAIQLLLRFGASACGVQLSKYLKSSEKLSCTDVLNQLPSFTWWGQDLPVEQLLKIRCSDLKAQLLESSEGGAVAKQLRIQVLEALTMFIPLLAENETLEVIGNCVWLLQHLQCHLEANHLAPKQPASLIALKDSHRMSEINGGTNSSVLSVAILEKFLASGSEDNKVRIYDLDNFSLVKELGEASAEVYSLAFSEKFLASGSKDKMVRIYDLDNFSLVKELGEASAEVYSLAFSKKFLASGSADKKVRIYDLDNFCLVKELEEATDCVRSVAFSEKFLASGSEDEKVRIYDLDTFCLVKELGEATAEVFSVAVSEMFLASGSADKKVRIYVLDNFRLVKELGEATKEVYTLAFSEKFLASGSEDNMVRIYDLDNFSLVKELGEATADVNTVAFSEKFLVSGSDDKKVRIYREGDFPFTNQLVPAGFLALSAVLGQSEESLLGILATLVQSRSQHQEADQILRKFAIELAAPTEQTSSIRSVAFSEKILASGSKDKKVRIYNLDNFSLVKELEEATECVFSVAFSEKFLASGSADKKVRIYDLDNFSLVKELEEATERVFSVAFSEKFLASGSEDEKVRIYDLDNFSLVKELGEANAEVYTVAFSKKFLASGSEDNKVRIYDLDSFSLVKELGQATAGVFSVAFSEKFLASGSWDNKVRIYELDNLFSLVKELGEATKQVFSVAVSEKFLASGSADGTVWIYFHRFLLTGPLDPREL